MGRWENGGRTRRSSGIREGRDEPCVRCIYSDTFTLFLFALRYGSTVSRWVWRLRREVEVGSGSSRGGIEKGR